MSAAYQVDVDQIAEIRASLRRGTPVTLRSPLRPPGA